MHSTVMRASGVLVAIAAASWLDAAKPASWNRPGQAVPAAPKVQDAVDARCREHARPPQLVEDKQVKARGWDLVDAYQGGWRVLVIGGTASYDGMCRPRQFQYFVFVGGVFAGTLSPEPMDSRTDGALSRVWLQSETHLTAEYLRYAPSDALCCPSKTTSVVFEIAKNPPIVHPVSASTSSNPK
jgi:hypothetical protein